MISTRDIFYEYIFVLKNSLNQRSLNQKSDDTDMWFSDSKILNIEYVGIFGVVPVLLVYPVILVLVVLRDDKNKDHPRPAQSIATVKNDVLKFLTLWKSPLKYPLKFLWSSIISV